MTWFISGSCPEKIIVEMSGDARVKQSGYSGTYTLADNPYNGRPLWRKGNHMIYFDSGWKIGAINRQNKLTFGLRSTSSADCPKDLEWEYYGNYYARLFFEHQLSNSRPKNC